MSDFSIAAPAAGPAVRAGVAALAVLIMTTIHHTYGAVIYDTPWRLHIVFVAVPVAIAFCAALYLGAAREGTMAGRAATWLGVATILVFPVALIGFFEGGYNHVVKNVAYFAGGEKAALSLFPEWLYEPGSVEMPDSLFFEATGIAQFPLGVVAAILALRLAQRTMA